MGDLQLSVQLVHAEAGSRVVLVQARRGDQILDAALGEAATAEEAEDRARHRLASRSKGRPAEQTPASQPVAPPAARPTQAPPSPPSVISPQLPTLLEEPAEPPADPDDWSSELARLDLQLQRLGWDRAQEGVYLERVFGHPSRNRLTSYGDLLAYLQALEGFSAGQDPASAPAPLRRRELLSQCDQLLGQLQWDPGQGRAFLETHFSLTSRQQLSDAQLLQFNMLLESEWLARTENPDPT
jgi:hypothetical protein